MGRARHAHAALRAAPTCLLVRSKKSCRGLRCSSSGCAAIAGGCYALLQGIQEKQEEHSCLQLLLLLQGGSSVAACAATLRMLQHCRRGLLLQLQASHCGLQRVLQGCKRLRRAAVVRAQACCHALLCRLLHGAPRRQGEAGGGLPAYRGSGHSGWRAAQGGCSSII